MNKAVRHLETGSYQPISQSRVCLPEAFDVEAGANRRVSLLLEGLGRDPVTNDGMKAAEDALSRFSERELITDDDWSADVAQEYAALRG